MGCDCDKETSSEQTGLEKDQEMKSFPYYDPTVNVSIQLEQNYVLINAGTPRKISRKARTSQIVSNLRAKQIKEFKKVFTNSVEIPDDEFGCRKFNVPLQLK